MMGAVDRFNRALAGTNMAMGRCKQRYHRALFLGWLLPAVGVLNVMAVFTALVSSHELDELKKSRRCPSLGFPRWFQQQLGEALIEYSVRLAKEKLGDVDMRAELGLSPSFMPMDRQRQATGFESFTFPTSHKRLKAHGKNKKIDLGSNNRCARCMQEAQQHGYRDYYIPGQQRKPSEKMVEKLPNGRNVPHTTWGCSVCRVFLCKECFDKKDADGNPHQRAWDHRNATRGLRAPEVHTE